MSRVMAQRVRPRNGLYTTVDNSEQYEAVMEDVQECPERVIRTENTCSVMIIPLEEQHRIKEWHRKSEEYGR
ncbi:hypothetical protein LX36DRAFT_649642 [Colletotrichum falcatum]|nr:hypothetical protein LX36DRAFT_649642 [Colletotrichum falcatum]